MTVASRGGAGWPLFRPGDPLEDCNRELDAHGLGDGLPAVPPTAERLERMLAVGHGSETSYGRLPPLLGDMTREAVAYQAVMAGCDPDWLEVIVAALKACLDPAFNLLAVQTTTGSTAVAILMSPSLVGAIGANASSNCLGQGNIANARIGRAVRLALTNIGGAVPGITDMATLGQPGKYGFCFGELDASPWCPPLHVRRGLAAEQQAVTAIAVTGTIEVVAPEHQGPDAIAAAVADSMRLSGSIGRSGRWFGSGEQIVLMPPDVIAIFDRAGWSATDVQAAIFEHGEGPAKRESPSLARSPEEIHLIACGGPGVKMATLCTWPAGSRSITRAVRPTPSAGRPT